MGRFFRFRSMTEQLRGAGDEHFRATRDEIPARAVLVAAGAMFAVIFALRMQSDSLTSGYALFNTLPIALLALRFGVRGGVAAAVFAELLFVVWAQAGEYDVDAAAYLTRATAFVTLGLLVGVLSEQLAANEARFSLTLRSSAIFVFTMDRDLRYTWMYHGWSGHVDTAKFGMTDHDLIDPEYAGRVVALKQRVLDSGESESAELPANDRDGKLRWFNISVEPTRDATGRIIGLTGSALDVTELHEAVEELRRSEERFRTAVENMLEPFALFSTVRDESGAITDFRCDYINPPGADSVGLTTETMQGMLLSELFPGRLEYELIDRYAHVVATGEPHVREEVDYINVFGEDTLVRAFDIRVARLGDGIEMTWRDITQKVLAESERDWSASIVDASVDAIMSAGLDGVIKSWSGGAERLYGWRPDEIIGRNFLPTLVPAALHEVRKETFSRVAAGEAAGPILATELRKDGTAIRVSFTATPMKNADGEIVGVARIVRPEAGHTGFYSIDEDQAATGRV